MSDNYAISLKRSVALIAALAFLVVLTAVNLSSLFGNRADAAQLSSRSLTLSSTLAGTETTGTAGSETNGSAATHTFQFTKTAASNSADRISFEYCTESIGACTTPTGLSLVSAAAGVGTNVTISAPVDVGGKITFTAASLSAGAATITVPITAVVNPNVIDDFYVRINLFADAAPSTILDDGTVASAITEGIEVTARVKETLGFSTTGSFAGVGDPGGSCAPVTGSGAITLGDSDGALSITDPFDNYSAFRIFTNAANGAAVQYEGETLTKGLDDIDALSAETASSPASEQFGIAVDTSVGGNNAVPIESGNGSVTLDMSYVSTSGNLALSGPLTISTDYDQGAGNFGTAEFNFATGTPTTIASSASYTNCKTVAVRYLANISPLTPAGTYTTAVVYSAVPTY